MAQKSVTQVLDDPSFKQLSPEVQRSVLGKLGVSADMQVKVLAGLSKAKPDAASEYDRYLASGQPRAVPRAVAEFPGTIGGRTMSERHARSGFLTRAGTRAIEDVEGIAEMGKGALEEIRHPSPPADPNKPTELFPYGRGPIATPVSILTAARIPIKQGLELAGEYIGDPAKAVGDIATFEAGGELLRGGPREARVIAPKAEAKPTPAVPEAMRRPPLTVEQQEKYTDTLDRANREHAQALSDYAEKEAQRRARWVEKTYGAKQSESKAHGQAAKKEVLTRGSDEYLDRSTQNIRQTHDTVRARLDSRWNSMREGMKGTEVGTPDRIYNGIRSAETEFLRGSPQSLQQFRNLVKELGIEDFVQNEDGTLSAAPSEKAKPLDWETAHVHRSAIGDRIASGGLPGNVYQALKYVHDKVLSAPMMEAAEAMGRGEEYSSLNRDWSDYMRDWRDASAVSGGGSPLAKIMQSRDSGFVRMQLTGKAGDRLISTLAKYKRHGARPELAVQARRLAQEAKDIPAGKVKPIPGKYEPGPVPRLKEVEAPKPKSAAEPDVPRALKAVGRIGGKLTGGAIGTLIKHPFLGWAAGGEVGQAGVEELWRRRLKNRPPIPPDLEPPTI